MKSFLLLTCFFLSGTVLYSQDQLHLMLSKAPLPAWVNKAPSETRNAVMTYRKSMGWPINPDVTHAVSESVDAQYEYLQSGRLLFNDEAGILLNNIADKILASKPEIRKTLQLHAFATNGTNIISFPSGLIVFELGIFAQLENEEQLAFLVSHEIAHFINGDYITQESRFQPPDRTEESLLYMEYLRKCELEADLLAYEMYEHAGFSDGQVLRLFDILKRNWSVPTLLPFATSFFSDSAFAYSQDTEYLGRQSAEPVEEGEFDQSSHNSFSMRKAELIKYYKLDSSVGIYQTPGADFKIVNLLAIYNCGLIALEMSDFSAALYAGYYLYSTDSASREESGLLISKAIYIYTSQKTFIKSNHVTVESEDIRKPEKFDHLFDWNTPPEITYDKRGHIKGVSNFLNQLTELELHVLSMKWTWQYSQVTVRHKDLAVLLARKSAAMLYLMTEESVNSLDSINISQKVIVSKLASKTPEFNINIRTTRKSGIGHDIAKPGSPLELNKKPGVTTATFVDSTKYINTQLQTCTHDSAFILFYTKEQAAVIDGSAVEERTNPHLQTDSVYFFGSNHVWLREYKRTLTFEINPVKTASQSKAIKMNIQNGAKSGKIHMLSGTPSKPDTLTLNGYNSYSLASRVFSEHNTADQLYFTFPLVYKEEFDSMCAENHITHAIVDLAVTKQFSKVRDPWTFVPFVIIPFTAPIALAYLIPSRCFTFRQTAVYNLQTGEIDWTWIKSGRGNGLGAGPYYSKLFSVLRKSKHQ